MKLMHEQIDYPGHSSVIVKEHTKSHFTYPWHFHEEFELVFVTGGRGTRFIADSVEDFDGFDLVLVGSKIPHFYRDCIKMGAESPNDIEYTVIQFSDKFFEKEINESLEFREVKKLLDRAGRGISFKESIRKECLYYINKIVSSSGFWRTIHTLELLYFLATTNLCKLLAGESYSKKEKDESSQRLPKVMHYLNSMYQHRIVLENVAQVANMHPSSFCRYFKEKTGKSLSEYINDIRISSACRLIMEEKLSISEICFECGYNNISNFNRAFKKNTGVTPSQYLEQYSSSDSDIGIINSSLNNLSPTVLC